MTKTVLLIRTELMMIFNQFRSTISNPSLLTFYGIAIAGTYFVSSLLSSIVGFAPMFVGVSSLIQDYIDISVIYTGFLIITTLSLIGGYFGIGASSILDQTDEYILMPSPIHPHQLFLTRYIRRLIQRLLYLVIAIIILIPVVGSGHIPLSDVSIALVTIMLFFEANYFIGGIAAFARMKVSIRSRTTLHLILPGFIFLSLIPSLFLSNPLVQFYVPAASAVLTLYNITGLYPIEYNLIVSLGALFLTCVLLGLFLMTLFNYRDYELFSTSRELVPRVRRFRSLIRGEVDFSDTRIRNPIYWIMLKDFWTRMRAPFQFWKYVYIVIGTVFVIFLNIFQPVWIEPIDIPGELNYAAIPAFLIIIVLMSQMTSVTSLLSFVDERENIYLLKVSPFESKDIVLSKYLLSLFESILAAIPLFGFLIFILRVENSFMFISLGLPFLLIFSASGTMFGAYIPVFTNNPRTPPIPLAFAFPTLNLIFGTLMIFLLSITRVFYLLLLPIITLILVSGFLMLSIIALRSYR